MLGYGDVPKGTAKVPIREGRGSKVSVSVTQWNEVSTATPGFEAGVEGPRAKECGLPLESGRGNKTASPTEPPEKNRALQTP